MSISTVRDAPHVSPMPARRDVLLTVSLVLGAVVAACSPSTEQTGSNSVSGSGGSSGAMAGAPVSGGSAGTPAAGATTTSAGNGGGGLAAGGSDGGSSSGGSGGGGGSLAGGGAGGGSGGSGGSVPVDARSAAEVLDGFAMLKPCQGWKPSGMQNNGDCCCEEAPANENQHVTKQFGGDPQVTYNVKVRIAGVAERYWYAGGELDPSSKLFYSGGLPTIHSSSAANTGLSPGQGACKIHPPETDGQFALPFTVPPEIRPEDGCYNGFNIFALTVSSPKKSYYLNYTTDFDNSDRQPHWVYKTDYTVTIPIKGQAQLDFYTIDGDHHQVTNNGTMQLGNLKTPQPYNGNFLEFTVLDVTVN